MSPLAPGLAAALAARDAAALLALSDREDEAGRWELACWLRVRAGWGRGTAACGYCRGWSVVAWPEAPELSAHDRAGVGGRCGRTPAGRLVACGGRLGPDWTLRAAREAVGAAAAAAVRRVWERFLSSPRAAGRTTRGGPGA